MAFQLPNDSWYELPIYEEDYEEIDWEKEMEAFEETFFEAERPELEEPYQGA